MYYHKAQKTRTVQATCGSLVEWRRLDLRLTQEQVAVTLGWEISALKALEAGAGTIYIDQLRELSIALGVEMSHFFPTPECLLDKRSAFSVPDPRERYDMDFWRTFNYAVSLAYKDAGVKYPDPTPEEKDWENSWVMVMQQGWKEMTAEKLLQSVGAAIGIQRQRREMEVSRLAKAVGLDLGVVELIELGQWRLTLDQFYAIAGNLRTPPGRFLPPQAFRNLSDDIPLSMFRKVRKSLKLLKPYLKKCRAKLEPEQGLIYQP